MTNKIPKSCLRHKVGILGIPPAAMKVDSAALYLHLEVCSLTYVTLQYHYPSRAHETSKLEVLWTQEERGVRYGKD